MSRTNVDLDDKLVDEAMRLTKKKTKKELLNFALEELVRSQKQRKILELRGKVEWVGNLEELRKSRV